MCWADIFTPTGMPPDRSRTRSTSGAGVEQRGPVGEPGRRDRRRALRQPADLGDPADDLAAGQVAAGAGLRALAQLEVQRLHLVQARLVPAEPAGRELVEVAGALGLLLRQHPALARADRRCRRPRRPRASAVLASAESAPKLMSDTNTGMSQAQRLSPLPGRCVTVVSTGSSSSVREAVQLRGEDLQVVPAWAAPARGTPIAATVAVRPGEPVAWPAAWISATNGSSAVSWCGSSKSRS